MGLSHEVHGSPAALPSGTRPEATPPATAPRKNGVISDAPAKAAPKNLAPASVAAHLRKAKPLPLKMIPKAAAVSGIHIVEAIDANGSGKAVHR